MEILCPSAARAALYATTRSRRRYVRHLKAHEGFYKWLGVLDSSVGNNNHHHVGISQWGVPIQNNNNIGTTTDDNTTLSTNVPPMSYTSPLDVHGPLHLTIVAHIEHREVYEGVGRLLRGTVRGAVDRGVLSRALVHTSDVLANPQDTSSKALFHHHGGNSHSSGGNSASIPHTSLLGLEGSSSFSRAWWTSDRCEALKASVVRDTSLYPKSKGYGPHYPSGTALHAAICPKDTTTNDDANTTMILARISKTISTAAKFQASKPVRQELENMPQELHIAHLAKETIEQWECGRVLVPFHTTLSDTKEANINSNNNYHATSPSWYPKAVVDLGGGNGSLAWLSSTIMPGIAQAVNAERFVTRYNHGIVTCEDRGVQDTITTITATSTNTAVIDGSSVYVPNGGCTRDTFGHGELSLDRDRPSKPSSNDNDDESGEDGCCGGGAQHHCLNAPKSTYGEGRWSPIDLPYYRLAHKDLRKLDWREDIRHHAPDTIVVTKHLCGEAVDHALRMLDLQQCWPRYLFISSCCHIKGSLGAYINKPYLQDTLHIRTEEEFRVLASKTAWLHQWDPTNSKDRRDEDMLAWQAHLGKAAEELLDYGRVLWLRERGYVCEMVEHIPHTITPRNRILVARRIDGYLPK